MFFVVSLLWLVGGLLAVSGFIVEKKPNAKEIIDKIVPVQGGIGIAILVVAVINIIRSLSMIQVPLLWITLMIPVLIMTVLGILLGYGLIVKYVLSKNEAAKEKADKIQATLVRFQTPVGWMSVGYSLLMVLGYIAFQAHGRALMGALMR